MGRHRYRPDRGSDRLVALKIISSPGGKLGIRRVTITSAFVVLVTGCGTTSAPSAFETLPPETTATQTTAPTTTNPAPATTVLMPNAPVPALKKPTTTVLAPSPPTSHPSHSAPVQGANPAFWVNTFCAGLNEENAASSALEQSPQSQPTAQDLRNELLQFLDTVQQGAAITANKLTQLGPPGVTGGKQVQDIAVEFFTTIARTYGDHRAKLAALDADDPDLAQKASQLIPGPADLHVTNTQLEKVTNNQELLLAFFAEPECQRLATPPTHR